MMRIFRAGDRVEWNPTGDEWKPGAVQRRDGGVGVLIALDENDQTLCVSPENLRQLDECSRLERALAAWVHDVMRRPFGGAAS